MSLTLHKRSTLGKKWRALGSGIHIEAEIVGSFEEPKHAAMAANAVNALRTISEIIKNASTDDQLAGQIARIANDALVVEQ